jgi:enoyl-CoA hydratase
MIERAVGDVLLERIASHIAVLRLNRPAALNAITAAMAETIEQCVSEIEADSTIRVAIITGEGRMFCVGADLKEVAAGKGHLLERPESGFAGFVYTTRTKPWIAALQGPAYGGGAEISLACDMIVAAPHVAIGFPEVCRGLIPGAGGGFRIGRALPRAVAIEMVTTGRPIDVGRAYQLGLVNNIAREGQALDDALKLACNLADNAPLAVREALAIARRAVDIDDEYLRASLAGAMKRVLEAPDSREGPQAFIEKRKPRWMT